MFITCLTWYVNMLSNWSHRCSRGTRSSGNKGPPVDKDSDKNRQRQAHQKPRGGRKTRGVQYKEAPIPLKIEEHVGKSPDRAHKKSVAVLPSRCFAHGFSVPYDTRNESHKNGFCCRLQTRGSSCACCHSDGLAGVEGGFTRFGKPNRCGL